MIRTFNGHIIINYLNEHLLFGGRRNEIHCVHLEAQVDLGVDTIDILAARTAAPAEGNLQLVDGNVPVELVRFGFGLDN